MSAEIPNFSLFLKVRKVIRYIHLFGLSRTLAKVKVTKHNKAQQEYEGDKYIVNAKVSDDATVAIIGCGAFAFANICFFLKKKNSKFLRYAFDIDKSKARSLCENYQGYAAINNIDHILNDEKIKLVYIASNHSTHAEYAIECLKHGKDVHIEKPHAVTMSQLNDLIITARNSPKNNVFLGFNRPKSKLVIKLKELLNREKGPLSLSFLIGGHEIPDNHWYFSEKEGGRVLGNLCHWTDLSVHLMGKGHDIFPCTIKTISKVDSKSNFIVSVAFNNGSLVSFNFSAKGYTFEGVREFMQVHKGELIVNVQDFEFLKYWKMEKVGKYNLSKRDHGHRANIINSFNNTRVFEGGESLQYVYDTGYFVIKIKEAIETGKEIVCAPKLIENIE